MAAIAGLRPDHQNGRRSGNCRRFHRRCDGAPGCPDLPIEHVKDRICAAVDVPVVVLIGPCRTGQSSALGAKAASLPSVRSAALPALLCSLRRVKRGMALLPVAWHAC